MHSAAILVAVIAACALGCGQRATTTVATDAPTREIYLADAKEKQTVFKAGAASAVVTPPMGTHIAGDAKNRRFTGIHDDIFAKAVVLDDGATPVAFVAVDCIGLPYPTVQRIRRAAVEKLSGITLPEERIIVSSTHTHAGPDVIGIWGPDETTSGVDPAYLDHLVEVAAEQVAKAAAARRPATLHVAETESGEGWVVNDCEPGEVDRSVVVLQCLDEAGVNIATLTNFACHPTCVDGTVSEVSADYIGAFYKEMSALYPGEHLFLQGAIGGWIQPITPERTFALAEDYGKRFAADVLAAMDQMNPVDDTTMRFANKVFTIPVANEGFKQLSALGIVDRPMGDTVETEVAWIAIGPVQIATHPGETSPIHGWKTKELMDSGPKMVVGLGLDELGYILKPEYFDGDTMPHAEYLVSMSPGPEAGPAMMTALESIIP
ncbi:MAG: neutral/alkaline non-lysosomal ceramidase N-terminal domain-containing protein [Candidatus Hydrogenedentes bacterium]|nr:neutral/alkaline non-lysosomal ceramidase N-terminal domain-containing protein [Candidatus Hydrogenedentota bacterium]